MNYIEITYKNGTTKRKYKCGKMKYNSGSMYWYDKQGRYHRTKGRPAIIYSNGDRSWFKHGRKYKFKRAFKP